MALALSLAFICLMIVAGVIASETERGLRRGDKVPLPLTKKLKQHNRMVGMRKRIESLDHYIKECNSLTHEYEREGDIVEAEMLKARADIARREQQNIERELEYYQKEIRNERFKELTGG